jgi:hypothetical protein
MHSDEIFLKMSFLGQRINVWLNRTLEDQITAIPVRTEARRSGHRHYRATDGRQIIMANNWQMHFRNFMQEENWFGVYHAGCAEPEPPHQGRANCWQCQIPYNATGTGDGSDVYRPSSYIVNLEQWLGVILEGLDAIINLAVFVGTGGEDVEAMYAAVQAAYNVDQDAINQGLSNQGATAQDLQNALAQNIQSTCNTLKTDISTLSSYVASMGLPPTGWGIIAGKDYTSNIWSDGGALVDGYGWTVLRAQPGNAVNSIANAAFIQNGHLIYLWDTYINDTCPLWIPY